MDETRRIDRSWEERPSSSARGDAGETPTDELDLPGGATSSHGAHGSHTADADTATSPMTYPVDDTHSTSSYGADDGFSQAETRRFETIPEAAPPAAYPTAAPSAAPPVHPAPAQPQYAPQPQAAPPPPMAQQPVHPGPRVAPRPVGPNGFARFASIVLALILVVPGLLLITYGIVVAVADIANEAIGSVVGAEVATLPGAGMHIVFLLCGAALVVIAALTGRLSGAGVGVTGILLVLAGLASLIWPSAVGDWFVAQPWFPSPENAQGLEALVTAFTSIGATVLGTLALATGGVFAAVAGAVHGARGAGWDRGRGL